MATFNGMLERALSPGEASVETAMNDELTYHRWSRVVDLFNDKTWISRSLYLPSLHPDFSRIRDLKPLARAESAQDLYDRFHKAKNQMTALRTWCLNDKLMNSTEKKNITAMLLMRSNRKDETFSSMSAFPSHLLYLWHQDDTYKALEAMYSLPHLVEKKDKADEDAEVKEIDVGTATVAKGKTAIVMLQNAESHHLQLANNFGYVLSKLNVVGGRHHEQLETITSDLSDRLAASHERVLNLEKAIIGE